MVNMLVSTKLGGAAYPSGERIAPSKRAAQSHQICLTLRRVRASGLGLSSPAMTAASNRPSKGHLVSRVSFFCSITAALTDA
jgi:hypothetical protein